MQSTRPWMAIVCVTLAVTPFLAQAHAGLTNQLQQGVATFRGAHAAWDGAGFLEAREQFASITDEHPNAFIARYWESAAALHVALHGMDELGEDDASRDLARQRVEYAVEAVEKALDLDPSSGACHAILGSLYGLRIGVRPSSAFRNGPRALRTNKKAAKLGPDDARVHYLLGSSALHAPRPFGGEDKALASLLVAEALYAKESGQPRGAMEPRWGHARCLANIGRIYDAREEAAPALAYYRRALEVNPNESLAQEGLSRMETRIEEGSEGKP